MEKVKTVDDLESGTRPLEQNVNDNFFTDESEVSNNINKLIQTNNVVLFSLSTCPFCIELKRSLGVYGIDYVAVEVDKVKAKNIRKCLFEIFSQKTFPMLIMEGSCKGGCDDFKILEHAKHLGTYAKYMKALPKSNEANRVYSSSPLFWFPDTVENNVVRISGGCVTIISILCIAFYNENNTQWVVVGLMVDFLLRLLFGSSVSIIGMFAVMIVSVIRRGLPPDLRTGAPKQFATSCGVFFSSFAAGLYLGNQRIGGAVVLAALAGAASLEAFLDFCFGCFFFGKFISYGLVSPSVYRASINLKQDKKWAWRYGYGNTTTYPVAVNEHVMLLGQTEETEIDLVRKNRFETEYKNQDFNVLKFTRIDYFSIPMSIVTLAYAFNLLTGKGLITSDNSVAFNFGYGYSQVSLALGIISAVIFVSLGILYLLKLAMYRNKVWKEWNNPTSGNLFSAISISLCLYGILMYPSNRMFGITIVWIGSGFQMLMSVLIVSRLVFRHISLELINPSILMAPVGNFVCAIALASYPFSDTDGSVVISRFGVNYIYVARLWFAVAMLFAITMFVVTFTRSFTDSHADVRTRPLLWVWQAASSVAGPALYAVAGNNSSFGTSLVYQCFPLISAFFFAVNISGWLQGFYPICNDASIWTIAFANAALAITTIHYYSFVVEDEFIFVLVVITTAIASGSCIVSFLHTMSWLFDGALFKPRQKWGPLTFMKLTHEAFRVTVPRIEKSIEDIRIDIPYSVKMFLDLIEPFITTYSAHSEHEDRILFPAGREYFPGLNPEMSLEHEVEHETVKSFVKAITVLKGFAHNPESFSDRSDVQDAVSVFQKEFHSFGEHLLAHLRNEEQSITVVMRKYMSIDRQKDLCKKSFELTSSDDWHVIIPFMMTALPHPVWKVRFLRTFMWALPDRCQEIGMMVYRGCDSVTFAFLADEIPEMVPRGVKNYSKQY